MKYKGSSTLPQTPDDQTQDGRVGVLLVNLGTPDAPTPKALRAYLKEFLGDPRVVEAPRLLWWFALNGVILNIRPRRSARSYAKVFTAEGSPLLFHSRNQALALQQHFQEQGQDRVIVDFAMRYGTPAMADVLESMLARGVRRLLVLPLYPQYSGSTSASVFDALAADFTRRRWLPDLRFVAQYHDYPPFIQAAADHIRQYWEQHGRGDRLLFSYHGIPVSYVEQGDPYQQECLRTSSLIAAALGIGEDEWLTTFQSRFGREEWLKPYTDKRLQAFPGQGVKSVQVFCPGFSADCLETLEEIGEENRDYFLEAGGEQYAYIPALNDSAGHIQALAQLVAENLQGW